MQKKQKKKQKWKTIWGGGSFWVKRILTEKKKKWIQKWESCFLLVKVSFEKKFLKWENCLNLYKLSRNCGVFFGGGSIDHQTYGQTDRQTDRGMQPECSHVQALPPHTSHFSPCDTKKKCSTHLQTQTCLHKFDKKLKFFLFVVFVLLFFLLESIYVFFTFNTTSALIFEAGCVISRLDTLSLSKANISGWRSMRWFGEICDRGKTKKKKKKEKKKRGLSQ